jgi:hypothetical protein
VTEEIFRGKVFLLCPDVVPELPLVELESISRIPQQFMWSERNKKIRTSVISSETHFARGGASAKERKPKGSVGASQVS